MNGHAEAHMEEAPEMLAVVRSYGPRSLGSAGAGLLLATACSFALGGTVHAQSDRRAREPVDEANPLVGTAPLDKPELIGNAPPAGEPLYSGITSPGARLPHSAVEAAPVNFNVELSYPTGVATPYYYTSPTMIGFTGGGGPTYGARATPTLMPVVGDWTVPPVYSQAYYDKTREKVAPGYYSVFLDTFKTRVELTATQAKTVLGELLESGGDPESIAKAKGFEALDDGDLAAVLDGIIDANPDAFEKLKAGDGKVVGFFTGQVMKATQGKADGKRVAALLQERAKG